MILGIVGALALALGIGLVLVVGGKKSPPVVEAAEDRDEEEQQDEADKKKPTPTTTPIKGVPPQAPPARDSITWINIPGGVFMMGSHRGTDDEQPVHQVSVSAFQMIKSEVTVAQYRRCFNAGRCGKPRQDEDCNWGVAGRDNHPVNCVTYKHAKTFCRWSGGHLPSEAQWEYAARSGRSDWRYPWGNETPSCARAVMGHPRTCSAADPCGCGRNGTWPVCSKVAGNTTHGLCDMAGNVFEWLADCWMGSYHGAPADGSAWQQEPCRRRFMRGGGWGARADSLRAAYRYPYPPARKYQKNYGFRCARPRR